jgi:hypothetical protein
MPSVKRTQIIARLQENQVPFAELQLTERDYTAGLAVGSGRLWSLPEPRKRVPILGSVNFVDADALPLICLRAGIMVANVSGSPPDPYLVPTGRLLGSLFIRPPWIRGPGNSEPAAELAL